MTSGDDFFETVWYIFSHFVFGCISLLLLLMAITAAFYFLADLCEGLPSSIPGRTISTRRSTASICSAARRRATPPASLRVSCTSP
jgi:hypothetical protein